MTFFLGVNEAGPLIANNADCVKSTITSNYFGSALNFHSLIGVFIISIGEMII